MKPPNIWANSFFFHSNSKAKVSYAGWGSWKRCHEFTYLTLSMLTKGEERHQDPKQDHLDLALSYPFAPQKLSWRLQKMGSTIHFRHRIKFLFAMGTSDKIKAADLPTKAGPFWPIKPAARIYLASSWNQTVFQICLIDAIDKPTVFYSFLRNNGFSFFLLEGVQAVFKKNNWNNLWNFLMLSA